MNYCSIALYNTLLHCQQRDWGSYRIWTMFFFSLFHRSNGPIYRYALFHRNHRNSDRRWMIWHLPVFCFYLCFWPSFYSETCVTCVSVKNWIYLNLLSLSSSSSTAVHRGLTCPQFRRSFIGALETIPNDLHLHRKRFVQNYSPLPERVCSVLSQPYTRWRCPPPLLSKTSLRSASTTSQRAHYLPLKWL